MNRSRRLDFYGTRLALLTFGVLGLGGGALLLLEESLAGSGPPAASGPLLPVVVAGTVPSEAGAPTIPAVATVAHLEAPVTALPTLPLEAVKEPRTRSARPRPPADARETALLAEARHLVALGEWAAALRVYQRLQEQNPASRGLLLERVSVLAWSGDHAAAAAALAPLILLDPSDTALRLAQAQYLWWSGQSGAAERSVVAVLQLAPDDAKADSLRTRIRESLLPTVELAHEWLSERNGASEHLAVARALVRGGAPGAALPHYRAGLGAGQHADSLYLEMARAATSADSMDAAVAALTHYLQRHPTDREVRLDLARVLGWAGRYPEALTTYTTLLAERDDLALRFERAQLHAWSGSGGVAEQELLKILQSDPDHVPALTLLGDLARWRGDGATALQHYSAASRLGAASSETEERIREASRMQLSTQASRRREAPATPTWRADADAFSDSDGFRWFESRVGRAWDLERGSVGLTVFREQSDGAAAATPAASVAVHGVELHVSPRVNHALTLHGSGTLWSSEAPHALRSWMAALDAPSLAGSAFNLAYSRRPATRRAATAVAHEAETVSQLVQLTVGRGVAAWHLWSRVELERLGSRVGDTQRTSGALALSRPLGAGFSGLLNLGALAGSGPSPVLPEWGPLYWSPEYYIAPQLGIAYRTELLEHWRLGMRVTPGFAFVREHVGARDRFPDSQVPTVGGGFEVLYARRQWQVNASGEWSGTAAPGYQAGALRLGLTFLP